MASSITGPGQVSDPLSPAAELFRMLENDGVSLERVVRDFEARANLVAFLNAGCPAFVVPGTVLEKPVEKPSLTLLKEVTLGDTSLRVYDVGNQLVIWQTLRRLLKTAQDESLDQDQVARLLKERGYAIRAAQAEEMLGGQASFFRKEEGGKDFGMRGDDRANLLLVESVDGTLSLVFAYWYENDWHRYQSSLFEADIWYRDCRLFAGNSDTSNR